ncbi:hypothetical protein L3X38_030079 [Prunus dulcis]|uniref:Uncharacterized protein n=1 Tax=Prunus dulcis TaxID=3755 RepID=A0AAD4YIU8_PRUDU|nr:hypothetical protein L3X38_030079 [Prunus dulcis]
MLNIFYWNVRGAGRKSLQNAFKDHCRVHDISICVMLEPRITGDNSLKVLKSLGVPKFERVDAMGFSGGIWVLWDDMRCKLEVVDFFEQGISALIFLPSGQGWLFTMVYGSPCNTKREALWQHLDSVAKAHQYP